MFSPSAYSVAIVDGIGCMARTASDVVTRRLGIGRRAACRILDIGGGSGAFTEVMLGANARATAVQVDYPVMNEQARRRLDAAGHGDRFQTVDGSFREVELAPSSFDLVIPLQRGPFSVGRRKCRGPREGCGSAATRAGSSVFNDYLTGDDGDESPLARLSDLNRLFLSKSGRSWHRRQVRRWFQQAGLGRLRFERAPFVTTLVYGWKPAARRRDGRAGER